MNSPSPFTLGSHPQDSQKHRQLLQALLNGVRRQLVEDLDRLVRAVSEHDGDATRKVAHAMLDLADAVRADALRSAASKLESLASDSSPDAIEAHLQALRAEAERCIAYIPVVVKGIELPTDERRSS
jgi:DNA-binding transcriptional ArsR family regulator